MTSGLKFILPVFLLVACHPVSGQRDYIGAVEKGRDAFRAINDGRIDEAIALFEEARKMDPENFDYPYGLAYAYFLQKRYGEAITMLEKLENHKDATDKLYQLLGNCYSSIGASGDAAGIYKKGLEKFPRSGPLNLELGLTELYRLKYAEALDYFEKGIRGAPAYASNYYWATKIYCNSPEEMWGMMYGEIFINMESEGKRSEEISRLLYDTYKREIRFTSDTSITVSFSQISVAGIMNLIDDRSIDLPFGMIYEPLLLRSVTNEKKIDLNSLDRIRTNFLSNYYKKGYENRFPNILFEYQNRILEAGHLEAYNHWLLESGDEKAFAEWRDANEEKLDDFNSWFEDNRLQIDETHRFYQGQYRKDE